MRSRREYSVYPSEEQHQHIMALMLTLPKEVQPTIMDRTPSGQLFFAFEGPGELVEDIRKLVVEIIGFETPGLRSYTLQEAYNTFGWRSYTNVRRKELGNYLIFRNGRMERGQRGRDMVINGIIISSGQISARIKQALDHSECTYVTLDELARDFEWPGGKPCGVVVPSKSVQKREDAQGHKYRIGFD